MSKCSDTRNLISELNNKNELNDTIVENAIEESYPGYKEWITDIENRLSVESDIFYNKDNVIQEVDIDRLIPDELERIKFKILSLLNSDPLLLKHYGGLLSEKYFLKRKPKKGVIPKAPKTLKEQLDYLDLGTLKSMLADLINRQLIASGREADVFARGIFGKIQIAYGTPESTGRLEKSGAVLSVARYMKEFAVNISRNINRFWSPEPGAEGRRGIENVINDIAELKINLNASTKLFPDFGERSMEEKKITFFSFLARGIIRKN